MKDKYRYMFYESIIFAIIYYFGLKTFKNQYLFEWIVHNYKLFLVIIAVPIGLSLLNQQVIATFATAGIMIGVFIGNFGGNLLRNINLNKIVDGMGAEEIQLLSLHQGFNIMFIIIVVSLVIGLIFQMRENRNG